MHLLSSNYFLLPSYYKERSKPFKKSIFFSVSSNFFLIPFPISSISFSWIILINIHILHTLSYLLCFFFLKKESKQNFLLVPHLHFNWYLFSQFLFKTSFSFITSQDILFTIPPSFLGHQRFISN